MGKQSKQATKRSQGDCLLSSFFINKPEDHKFHQFAYSLEYFPATTFEYLLWCTILLIAAFTRLNQQQASLLHTSTKMVSCPSTLTVGRKQKEPRGATHDSPKPTSSEHDSGSNLELQEFVSGSFAQRNPILLPFICDHQIPETRTCSSSLRRIAILLKLL